MTPHLLIAAHGSRSDAATRTVRAMTAAVRGLRPGLGVTAGYLDVVTPRLAGVLAATAGPVVVVPYLLGGGYHVRTDIPAVLAAAGRSDPITGPLGPDPVLTSVLCDRLVEARGARPPADEVAMAWAGSSDPAAVADAATAADLLAQRMGRPVRPIPLSGPDRVTTIAADVEVASYLLAPGEFADRAIALGAVVTAAPLGTHPALAELVLSRYDDAT